MLLMRSDDGEGGSFNSRGPSVSSDRQHSHDSAGISDRQHGGEDHQDSVRRHEEFSPEPQDGGRSTYAPVQHGAAGGSPRGHASREPSR